MPDGPVRLDQLNIIAGDMERSLAFYRLLGVDVPDVWQGSNGRAHASDRGQAIDIDLDTPAFATEWNAGWAGRPDLAGRVVVGFKVADRDAVDRLYETLTGAGHVGLQPPWDAFWGARYAVVEDPDGLAIGLMSPIDQQRRWEIPP